jgi:antirestriction protein ArdC
VAEIGAAFLCVKAGVTAKPREDHAHYLKSWIAVLKADNRAIFTAACQAQKAADYLGPPEKAATAAGQQRWLIASL